MDNTLAKLRELRATNEPPLYIQVPVKHWVAYRVDNPVVHDADTLSGGVIRLPWNVAIADKPVRADYDAKEITKTRQKVQVTDEELKGGITARDSLIELLKNNTLYISLPEKDIDPYDRIDSVWWLRYRLDGTIERVSEIAKRNGWLRK